MLAAAAMMVASTVASAQSMRVEIPFTFRANGAVMPPGSYQVTSSIGEARFQLQNIQARKGIALVSAVSEDAPKQWVDARKPTLQFACGEGICSLKRIWTATGTPAHVFPIPAYKEYARSGLAMVQVVGTATK
jgi:hypothetical protein